MNNLLHGDCLDLLPTIETNSVDLVCIDPPYNISKADWDTWKNPADYIEFMGRVFLELQRVLKDNGSMYWFHNDMPQIVKLMAWLDENTEFVFKQFITWNKIDESFKNNGFVQQRLSIDMMRNYYGGFTEYCLFYTFQDETGLTRVMGDYDNFVTIKNYLRQQKIEFEKNGLSLKNLVKWTKHFHTFAEGQSFGFPTKDSYSELQSLTGFFQREYEDLRREYEDLRREYEDLRYTFNNQIVKNNLHANSNVWVYPPAPANGHETPKSEPLIENIILHSSNEGDTVLDCFMGSGTTGAVCVQTGRNFIGIEKGDTSFEYAKKRINDEIDKPKQYILIGA